MGRPVITCPECGRKVAVTTGVRVLGATVTLLGISGTQTKWIPDEHPREDGTRCPGRSHAIEGTDLEGQP